MTEKWESLVRGALYGRENGKVNMIAGLDAIMEGAEEIGRLRRDLKLRACAFCGHEFTSAGRVADAEMMVDHVLSCERHPLRWLAAENGRLREDVERLRAEREA